MAPPPGLCPSFLRSHRDFLINYNHQQLSLVFDVVNYGQTNAGFFYFRQILFLSCLTVSFASQSSNSMTGQSYRKINFPLQVWNLISSSKTEEVSIAPNSQQKGIMECGVACNIKSDCGGFLYDKTSGECTMKSVKNICISIELFWFVLSNVFLQQFLCLLKLTTPSDVQSSVGVYVKTERFAPCLGLGKLD